MSKDNVIAVDDGYFPIEYKARNGYTTLVSVKYKVIEKSVTGVSWKYVLVDGLDATIKTIEMVKLLSDENTLAILLDGITYAGFNIVDPYKVYEETKIPCIVFYRYSLNPHRIRKALETHFSDFQYRYSVIEKCLNNKYKMTTPWRIVEYTPVGISPEKASQILRKLQLYSPEPEPLKIADQISSRISRILLDLNTL